MDNPLGSSPLPQEKNPAPVEGVIIEQEVISHRSHHFGRYMVGAIGLLLLSFLITVAFFVQGTLTPQSLLDFITRETQPKAGTVENAIGAIDRISPLVVGKSLFFSEDRTRYAYLTSPTASTTEVVVGADRFVFPANAQIAGFTFAATGTRYIFGIEWMNASTTEAAIVTDGTVVMEGAFSVADVSISPDGTRAAHALRETQNVVVYIDGVEEETAQAVSVSKVAWSEDSRSYAYLVETADGDTVLVVNGISVRKLTGPATGIAFAADGTLYANGCAYVQNEPGSYTSSGCQTEATFLTLDANGMPAYVIPENPNYPTEPSRAALSYRGKRIGVPCEFNSGGESCFSAVSIATETTEIAYAARAQGGQRFGIGTNLDTAVFENISESAISGNGNHFAYSALTASSAVLILDGHIIDEVTLVAQSPFYDLQFSPEGIHFAYLVTYGDASIGAVTTELMLDGIAVATYDHIDNISFDEPRGVLHFNAITGTEALSVTMPIPERTFVRGLPGRTIERDALFAANIGDTAYFWRPYPIAWGIEQLGEGEIGDVRIRIDVFSRTFGRVVTIDEPISRLSGTTTFMMPGLVIAPDGTLRAVPEGAYRLHTTLYRGSVISGTCGAGVGGNCSYDEIIASLSDGAVTVIAQPRSGVVRLAHSSFKVLLPEGALDGAIEQGEVAGLRWRNDAGGAITIELIPFNGCADVTVCQASATIAVDAANTGSRQWQVPMSVSPGKYFIRMKDQSRRMTVVSEFPLEILAITEMPGAIVPAPVTQPSPTPIPTPTPKPTPTPSPTPAPTPTPTPTPQPTPSPTPTPTPDPGDDDDSGPSIPPPPPPPPGGFEPF